MVSPTSAVIVSGVKTFPLSKSDKLDQSHDPFDCFCSLFVNVLLANSNIHGGSRDQLAA